jgi:DNA-binding CsgD family transcriptional regulator
VGETHRCLSRLSWFLGRSSDAERHGQEALEVLEPGGASLELAWALSNASQLHMLADRTGEAIRDGERAIGMAQAFGNGEVLAHALNNVGTAYSLRGEVGTGTGLVERSLSLALDLEIEEHVARAHANLGSTAVDSRRLKAGRSHLEAGLDYCGRHDLDSCRLYLLGWMAFCEFWEGRYAAAARIAETTLAHRCLNLPGRIQPLVVLGRVRARRGEPRVEEPLDEALVLASATGELQRIALVRAARAEACWLDGDVQGVRMEARATFELALSRSRSWAVGELGFWLWRVQDLDGPPGGAARPYALQMGGSFGAAVDAWEELGCPYERAMALADLDDPGALYEAHQGLERLGARPLADRVTRRLRKRGIRGLPRQPRASTRANPAGLTLRQVAVLRLLRLGHSNAEIADRLCVSPKTVDHHVSAVLAKLGARNRAEAAGRAAGLLPELGSEGREK